tara:strand:- start:37 stop:429 length:393 start_codon:yes stop_codon:yes gene_type:complete
MNKRIALVATLLAGIVGVGAIAPVMAESHTAADAAEIQAMATVKLTLAQASAAAEAQFGGTAVEVALDVINGTPTYTVSLLAADGTESEALVDAVKGTVTAAPADETDENGGETEESDNGAENGEETEAQ